MAKFPQKCIEQPTSNGLVSICSFCSAEFISTLEFKQAFQPYSRYHPIISKKETLIEASKEPDANIVVAFTIEKEIIGFSVLQYPSKEERWSRVGEKVMMEVSVIEVGRNWRGMGISKQLLLRTTNDHPLLEDRIFYMVGYSWTWDLNGSKMTVMQYRDMMVHLFSSAGFKIYQTNEPNVLLRPENLFMARMGANIPPEIQKRFKKVLFNLDL